MPVTIWQTNFYLRENHILFSITFRTRILTILLSFGKMQKDSYKQ